jgi:predicted lipoprotein
MLRQLPYLLLILFAFGCTPDGAEDDERTTDSFDRQAMLAHWADNVFAPASQDFSASTLHLRAAAQSLNSQRNNQALDSVRTAFRRAYRDWQRLSPFMTGEAETQRVRERINTYPTDTARLLSAEDVNLALPSNTDIQGFPALDYLLYGTDDPLQHGERIAKLTETLVELAGIPLASWTGEARDAFVANSGNSATASVDRTVNDFIFWYEKHLRAGKVGIPAGVFSGDPLPGHVEARYAGEFSKPLFLEGLKTARSFFRGEPGLKDYLDALDVRRDGQLLSERIANQFNVIEAATAGVNADFGTQVRSDNTAMLQLYDALQANTILLKVDMLQALSINVDYVDADGD